ncbi:MAG: SOS response-associated peptidase [Deltaproteobacteria bacterium]|jgi:putative SOS response-associated peptidase YedK|nr:SOS response-associated peptidase [Deltaproteobacteria bacterium]
MCGRFSSWKEENDEEINKIIQESGLFSEERDSLFPLKTRGDVHPTDVVPVIYRGGLKNFELRAAPMRWGYPGYPDKMKPNVKPRPLINAKGETAPALRTWKDSLRSRRCVVPTSGFYEWSSDKAKNKIKHLFTDPRSPGLLLGGVYKRFKDESGAAFPHFSIITIAANDSMIKIHNRMPLVLTKKDFPLWFSATDDFTSLLNGNSIELESEPV